MYSYWEKQDWFEHYEFVIVGAGIVGLTTAYYLNKYCPGKKILVIDRHFIPSGASTKNAGFSCFGTVGEILDDLETVSRQEVINTIRLRWNGLNRLKEIHTPDIIEYMNRGGYEVFTEEESFEFCLDKVTEVNDIMEEAIGISHVFKIEDCLWSNKVVSRCISNALESELNPVRMIKNLITMLRKSHNIDFLFGLRLNKEQFNYEGKHIRISKDMNIAYEKLMLCTNAFSGDLINELDLTPYRNQVIVSEVLQNVPFSGTFHYDKGYVYFREIHGRLLIGGARNIDPATERTSEFGSNLLIIEELKRFAAEIILQKEVKFDFQWSGIIATGSSKKPILKSVNDHTFLAARLGGMGVAIGSELAWELTEKVIA
ncbi:MAG: FAD-binding oxidoreductase [Saprospiraceae bacterium]|nr:FAD-binding oxidoreductase [Bacteroidia bacterium]NNF21481.1 FAD-binding oxidoreductase [Saprospiraceae bacterium]